MPSSHQSSTSPILFHISPRCVSGNSCHPIIFLAKEHWNQLTYVVLSLDLFDFIVSQLADTFP